MEQGIFFFLKISNTDKPLARMIRETMREAQRPRSGIREMILLQILQILKRKQHSIIDNFSQQVNNLDEMDNFLESLQWPEFTQVETE